MQAGAPQMKLRYEEIEEESEEPGSVAHSLPDHEIGAGAETHAECPLCLGTGALLPGTLENGWQEPDRLLGTYAESSRPWDSRSARRRRHSRRAGCLWGRSCQALLVSTMYITLALALVFLGVMFYPRNPDFDLVDVHFTRLQLRWIRDLNGGAANESSLDSLMAKLTGITPLAPGSKNLLEEDRKISSEEVGKALGTSKGLGGDNLTVVEEMMTRGFFTQEERDMWEDIREAAENNPTIFGRRLVLDIDLLVTVLVKNPNKVGVHYQASSLDIIYKDKKLGEALLPPGQQAAASSTLIIVPAQLNGLSTFGMSFALLRDWEKREIEMDIAARFTGTVDLIKLIPHEFIADMFCDVLTNPRNLEIMKRTCHWKYGGRI